MTERGKIYCDFSGNEYLVKQGNIFRVIRALEYKNLDYESLREFPQYKSVLAGFACW
jgi:hypothetical protein